MMKNTASGRHQAMHALPVVRPVSFPALHRGMTDVMKCIRVRRTSRSFCSDEGKSASVRAARRNRSTKQVDATPMRPPGMHRSDIRRKLPPGCGLRHCTGYPRRRFEYRVPSSCIRIPRLDFLFMTRARGATSRRHRPPVRARAARCDRYGEYCGFAGRFVCCFDAKFQTAPTLPRRKRTVCAFNSS
jgi:hypothetical protein